MAASAAACVSERGDMRFDILKETERTTKMKKMLLGILAAVALAGCVGTDPALTFNNEVRSK